MEQKLIFLDIDGTLTMPGSTEPPASALEAIRRAQAAGHLVLLCSGRNKQMVSPLLKYGFDGFIASAGGYIEQGGQVLYDCPMEQEQLNRVLECFRQGGMSTAMECLNGSYADQRFREFVLRRAMSRGNTEFERWKKMVEDNKFFRPVEEYDGAPVYKVVFMSENSEQLQGIRKQLESEFRFCLFLPAPGIATNGELINRRFSKGSAIRKICGHLNIPVENTVAIGDSMNDYEMIQTAALGICMDNGVPELKAIADDICPAVSDDGLYKAFQKHGLM